MSGPVGGNDVLIPVHEQYCKARLFKDGTKSLYGLSDQKGGVLESGRTAADEDIE